MEEEITYVLNDIVECPLFDFMRPWDNDSFSNLSGSDLNRMLTLLDGFYISLLSEIGASEGISFGLEIEFEEAQRSLIEDELYHFYPKEDWFVKSDASLKKGAEINSPVLTDCEEAWGDLGVVCAIIKNKAIIGEKAGGHVHVGTQLLGGELNNWLNFFKLWSTYENVIYRFAAGEFLTPRPSASIYAVPISNALWRTYERYKDTGISIDLLLEDLKKDRRQAVNFQNVNTNLLDYFGDYNTIEFRCPNGTLEPAVWQNNINFFISMLYFSRIGEFDGDIVNKRHIKNEKYYNDLDLYNEIYLDQALELCDMLYGMNYQKFCFLKQYLKSFNIADKYSPKTITLVKPSK